MEKEGEREQNDNVKKRVDNGTRIDQENRDNKAMYLGQT